ncbi:MAG: HD domain-containing protein [Chitinivibrionales bacterium]|nr:HD domain-containing protein [Chitinivibrionales bacterium]
MNLKPCIVQKIEYDFNRSGESPNLNNGKKTCHHLTPHCNRVIIEKAFLFLLTPSQSFGKKLMADRENFAKKIDIDNLQTGMFLEDVFNEEGAFLLSRNSLVESVDQIERLKNLGVKSVYINIQKGKDVSCEDELPDHSFSDDSSITISSREARYYEEIPRALEVREKTLITAREALVAISKGRSFSVADIEVAAEDIVESILRNSEALVSLCQIKGHDEYTYIHSVNVGVLITSLANSMGYDRTFLLHAGIGGLLHDIGKMRVPDAILNKPGRYADWEFAIMKKHPEHGIEIIKEKKSISPQAAMIIAQHHERYNGRGYPRGLKGKEISELGLMAAVADVYDALTSDRVYRAAWTPQKALATIFKGCDEDYSRAIVERFTKHMGIYPVGSFVKLNSGEMGVVVRVDNGKLLKPVILVLFDTAGKKLDAPVEYDLSKKVNEIGSRQYEIEMSLNPRAFRIDVGDYLESQKISHLQNNK